MKAAQHPPGGFFIKTNILTRTLLFVYNANSNRWDKLFGILHKAINPDTYMCDLCNLTHGLLKEKDSWTLIKEKSQFKMTFLYKDQFMKLHGFQEKRFSFPIILEHKNGKYQPIVTAQEIEGFEKVEELMKVLQK